MRLIDPRALVIVTIMQETASEPYEGKVAVAEVIRNRMERKYQSDGTLEGTVLKAMQFSGWNATDPGRIRSVRYDWEDPTVKDCLAAWDEAINKRSNTVDGALLYFNPKIVTNPASWFREPASKFIKMVGQHSFWIPKEYVKG